MARSEKGVHRREGAKREQQKHKARAPPKLRRRERPARQPRVLWEHLDGADPRHPLRDALAVVPQRPADLERHGHLDLGAVVEPLRHAAAAQAAVGRAAGDARARERRLAAYI